MPDKPWRVPIADYRRTVICDWTEKQLQDQILDMAKSLGWLAYHTHDSRRSQKGFPDLTLVHEKQRRLLFWELKSQKGRATPEQKVWMATLTAAGHVATIIRPSDWADGVVEKELRGTAVA